MSPWLFLLLLGISVVVVYILLLENSVIRVFTSVIIKYDDDASDNRNMSQASRIHSNVEPISTSSSNTSSCRRPCPFRRNVIVLDHFGAAGLNDREWVFHFMANLAGYLCATVYAPPPFTMLSIKHNGGIEIPTSLHWNDFFTMAFHDDHTRVLQQYETDHINATQLRKRFHLREIPRFLPPHQGPDPLVRVSLEQPTDFIRQLEDLDQFVIQQQQQQTKGGWHHRTAFVWEIYVVPYHYAKEKETWIANHTTEQLQAMPEQGCPYFTKQPSTLARTIADQVLDRIQSTHPTTAQKRSLALLHIRRGDGILECNSTSLLDMQEYLFCSFAPRQLIESHYGSITILLASDERDPCYRTAIKELITGGLGFEFVDLDATVQEVIQNYSVTISDGDRLHNNMFIYQIVKMMAWDPRMNLFLQKRRRTCPICSNVLKKFGIFLPTNHSSLEVESTMATSGWSFADTLNNYEFCQDPSKWRRYAV